MNCALFLLAAFTACGILFQRQRTKLKARYTLSIVLIIMFFSVYEQFPVCGNPAYRHVDKFEDSENIEETELNKLRFLELHLKTKHNATNILNSDVKSTKKLLRKNEKNNQDYDERKVTKRKTVLQKVEPIFKKIVDSVEKNGNTVPPKENKITQTAGNKLKRIKVIVDKKNIGAEIEKAAAVTKIATNEVNGNKQRINQSKQNDEIDYDDDATADDEEANDANDDDGELMDSPKLNNSVANRLSKNFAFRFSKASNNFLFQNTLDKEEKEKYFFDLQKHKKVRQHSSPQDIKAKMQNLLPWWELTELMNYPRIWYVGEKAQSKLQPNMTNPYNYGFDKYKDLEGGIYKITAGDHLEYRYEIVKKLGAGSFGSVVLARDHALYDDDSHRMVAIKIMHNDSSTERYFKKEIDLMKMIYDKTKGSERFSTVLRTFFFRNHLCYVMELLNSTIEESRKDEPVVNLNLLKKYARDVLKGLVLLHKENIIHGDLKPENLMFVPRCNISCPTYVKVVDFSLSCIPKSEDFECPGAHFQTRLYRAPEVIMDLDYSTTADMWSVGVIMAELYMNKVPFYGESGIDQLASIMEVMGLLPPYMVETSPNVKTYQKAVCYKCKNGFQRVPYRKSLPVMLDGMPADLYDFIKQCLELDYRKRMTSLQALNHKFLTSP